MIRTSRYAYGGHTYTKEEREPMSLFSAEKRTPIFIIIAIIALVLSFMIGDSWGLDPAWLAVLLCGVPIVLGAIKGLVTAFD
jgi:hypothetical protein